MGVFNRAMAASCHAAGLGTAVPSAAGLQCTVAGVCRGPGPRRSLYDTGEPAQKAESSGVHVLGSIVMQSLCKFTHPRASTVMPGINCAGPARHMCTLLLWQCRRRLTTTARRSMAVVMISRQAKQTTAFLPPAQCRCPLLSASTIRVATLGTAGRSSLSSSRQSLHNFGHLRRTVQESLQHSQGRVTCCWVR